MEKSIESPYSHPTVGRMCWESHNSKRHMHPNVHCSTIYNSQNMAVTQMFIDRWIENEDVIHIYKGILLSHKKNESESVLVT